MVSIKKSNKYRLYPSGRMLLFFFVLFSSMAFGQPYRIDTTKITGHPRLLLLQGQEEGIKKNIAENPVWNFANSQIIDACEAMLVLPKIERVLVGRRLLDQSRECLRRVFYLSYAWRLTQKKKYFKKCEEELLAVSRFSDWNPDHFLDVAEMTTAVAIGYDWLYNDLSMSSKEIIRNAIIGKGIEPSFNTKYNWWLKQTNNWNQVCNTGVAYGAIAVYEDKPQLSAQVINRSLESILVSMKGYAPDGNYAEGYNYWGYGTSYNVLFISALERLFGTDYGLSQQPGFLKTAAFYENLETPAGYAFNYSDAANGGGQDGLQPAMFWFAEKLNDPTVLFSERDNLVRSTTLPKWNRFLPAIMLWGTHTNLQAIVPPSYKLWNGKGENAVAMMRTAWDNPNAIFVGLKAGSPSSSHGHMDAGSFVMDADGVRWGADPGMQEYESLESKGIKIWSGGQHDDRWKVFRLSNFSHSTLTVNNSLQQVTGHAPIISSSGDSLFLNAVTDITSLYSKRLVSAKRGVAIVNKQYVSVRDEIETGDTACTIRWAMFTPATVSSINGNQLQLTNKGRKLTFSVVGIEDVQLRTWPTDPPNSWDALNLGTTLVGFEITVPAHTKRSFNVLLVPGEGQIAIKRSSLKPLGQW